MKSRYLSLGFLALLGSLNVSLPQVAQAQVAAAPSLLNFQGRLTKPDGTPVADGTYSVRFSLHDALTGGTETWNQTLGTLTVRNGIFAALLSGFPGGTFNGNLWMEIKIGTEAPLTPRQQLVSVAYAMKANTVPDGSITADKLAGDALNNLSWLLGGNAASASHFLGTTNNQPLMFKTNNAERMRLLANGNLGIGTNTPGMSLEVTTPAYYGAPALGGSFGANRWAYLHIGSTDPSYIWNTGSAMRFGTETARGTGYAEWMRITSDGKLAIGTQTATSPLTFRNADERKITFYESSDVNNKFYGIDMSVGGRVRHWAGVGGSFEVGHYNTTDDSFIERFRVNGNGNVGIGISAPAARLDVNGSAGIRANNVLEFGLGLAGKEANAGRIGYQTFTPGALDIVGAGTSGTNRKIKFWNEGGATFAGEVIAPVMTVTGGSDVAEPYNVASAGNIKAIPGMLVAIDEEKVGQMKIAAGAYNMAVAGIISGANGIKPGLTLTQKGTVADGELPVASIGRVWCWCDADANGAIKAGDMLTTSDTPGHAMKATDRERWDGAIIGKAMSSLKAGRGLVLVLVGLK